MSKRSLTKAEQDTFTEVMRVTERHKTLRTLIICVTVLGCVVAVGYWAYHIMYRPAWLMLALALIGPLSPCLVLYVQARAARRYTKRTTGQLAAYQQQEDPGRTSSGMMPDGTDPPGS